MIAVVPVREGRLPLGAAEAAEVAGGQVLVCGERSDDAARELLSRGAVSRALAMELGPFAPARFSAAVAPLLLEEDVVVLPGVPDGRDLAPRIAFVLDRPLVAGASKIAPDAATVVRFGGLQSVELSLGGPFVATLLTGAMATRPAVGGDGAPTAEGSEAPVVLEAAPGFAPSRDAELLSLLEPDPASVDLGEAERILAGGAGLHEPSHFDLLARVANELKASVGATRVVTDSGVLPHERQIGTTGVSVRPRLYVAFGISGAAQHVGGLGEPAHVIAVNIDGSCPMMAMADLAIVSDAPSTLQALAERLGVSP